MESKGQQNSQCPPHRSEQEDVEEKNYFVFWLHIIIFMIYNGIIGCLLVHRLEDTPGQFILYTLAMGFHFIVNDHALFDHYKRLYLRWGRWLLVGAIIAGFVIGMIRVPSESAIAIIFSFLSGGIILNVLKEELPEERRSNYMAYIAGATIYAFLLLIIV